MRIITEKLFGLDIYAGSKDYLLGSIEDFVNDGIGYENMFTPNVDHICKLEDSDLKAFDGVPLRWEYRKGLLIADGMPISWASKLMSGRIERIAGSDLLIDLLDSANVYQWSISFVLSSEELSIKLNEYISKNYPGVKLLGNYVASKDFEARDSNAAYIASEIAIDKPQIVIVCLGFPKQERWLIKYGPHLGATLGIGLGAAPEFLVGSKKRAPKWAQKIGCEWVHRAFTDRRLIPRYIKNFYFLILVIHEWVKSMRR